MLCVSQFTKKLYKIMLNKKMIEKFKQCENVINEYDYFKVNGLSEFEKEVLKLKNRNYRPKEIAIKLQCDIKSIYNCLCRIKTKIKND